MLKSEDGFVAINGVGFAEGKFTCSPTDYESLAMELTYVYMNVKTGMTLGSCPIRGSMISDKTRDTFRTFLESAEEDVAIMLGTPDLAVGQTVTAEAHTQTINQVMKGK